MQKVIINLGEVKQGSKKPKNQNKGENNLYYFLIFKMLRFKIKDNALFINPNFERINFLLEVYFSYKNTQYHFIVDGKDKLVIANNIKLCNINKISLEFLKQQKSVM